MSYDFPLSSVVVRPHNRFDMIHEIVEVDERKLSFEVGIFAQMAASVT